MEEILLKIDSIITLYNSGAYMTKDKLVVANRELTSNIYFLTKHNIQAFNEFNSIIYNSTSSVAKATSEAHQKVPQLRMTRKILDACKGVSIALNNELQIMKNE